uniref:Uncharacterized protein n=1 Tax=Alexandrium monilatum TaxID=311494 RepID=A0A7S4RVZ1_9DINO|mmetsp:Transcript_99349/g.315357  ORF Transcript_99349/g.315357 Transcript_99349/m.315357 type:complete len:268 (+) Transcript_99349:273-1076(+)
MLRFVYLLGMRGQQHLPFVPILLLLLGLFLGMAASVRLLAGRFEARVLRSQLPDGIAAAAAALPTWTSAADSAAAFLHRSGPPLQRQALWLRERLREGSAAGRGGQPPEQPEDATPEGAVLRCGARTWSRRSLSAATGASCSGTRHRRRPWRRGRPGGRDWGSLRSNSRACRLPCRPWWRSTGSGCRCGGTGACPLGRRSGGSNGGSAAGASCSCARRLCLPWRRSGCSNRRSAGSRACPLGLRKVGSTGGRACGGTSASASDVRSR